MRVTVFATAISFLALSAIGSSAHAVTLSQQASDVFDGGGNRLVNHLSNRPGVRGLAGGFRLSDGTSKLIAWCLDVMDDLSLPGSYNITTAPFSGNQLSQTQLSNIETLFEVNYPTLDLGKASDYSDPGAVDDQSAGFQMALWELVYETGPTFDVTDGSWSIGSTFGAIQAANSFLATLLNPDIKQHYKFTFYQSVDGSQNLVSVSPVPLPAAGGLLGMGLVGLYGMSRRKKVRKTS